MTAIDKIIEELQPVDTEELYDQMLDEVYTFESVGGPFKHMSPSSVLKSEDKVAYREGWLDWLDDERRGLHSPLVEIDGDDEELYFRREDIEDLVNALAADAENEGLVEEINKILEN